MAKMIHLTSKITIDYQWNTISNICILLAPKDIKNDQDLLMAYEEWRAQKYLYKNQGLYPQSGVDWVMRINRYGINSTLYDSEESMFTPKWWHFIYKIPRRW